uniref:Secreted protein n=1 Tax=Haemonchus contortus TaxID=6289 RepID=A0A7I4YJ49_HAECO
MEVFHATILALAFLTAAVHAQRGHDEGLESFRRFLERERSNPSYFKSKQDLHKKLWHFLEKERLHAYRHLDHVNELLNYLKELGRLDKSLTRLSDHAKDRKTVERIRENLRHYFDREFEKREVSTKNLIGDTPK